jgi:hypothetical protein
MIFVKRKLFGTIVWHFADFDFDIKMENKGYHILYRECKQSQFTEKHLK